VHAGGHDVLPIAALALVPGLAALLLYYRGLRRTEASAATLAELAFPLTALVVNALAFGTVLEPTQYAGAALLAGTVVALGVADGRGATGVVPHVRRPRPSPA
jgi:drug/metabolite transporter (DMT)-like permease